LPLPFNSIVERSFRHACSPECRADLVAGLYGKFLQRAPESFGFNAAMQALATGFSEESLIAVLVGSDEYFASPAIMSASVT
jgi:hypothetical protein